MIVVSICFQILSVNSEAKHKVALIFLDKMFRTLLVIVSVCTCSGVYLYVYVSVFICTCILMC